MRRQIAALAFLALLTQVAFGDVKSDILALTGNARTKLMWVRWPWCANDYTPVQAYKATAYENDHNFTQLVVFDTDEGFARYLDSTVGSHCMPKITRKDGKYVIWNDKKNQCAWIRDFAGATAARKLIIGGDYFVLACQWNPVSDSEYVYVLGRYDGQWVGGTIVRIPIKADGTVDLTSKKTVVTVPDPNNLDDVSIDWHGSASEDGKYIGCMVPQPDGYLWNAETGAKHYRHDVNSEYGCQPNIAPDNSYRFFHLTDAHVEVAMWGPGTAASTYWLVNIVNALPGNAGGKNNANQPRWTNDVRFYTVGYPLETGLASNGRIFTMTAAQVQAADAATAGSFCLARFSDDFKSVTGAVRVSDGDVRHRDVVGDAWIKPSGVGVAAANTPHRRGSGLLATQNGGVVTVTSELDSRVTAGIADAQGRLVRLASGRRAVTINAESLGAGVYFISARDKVSRAPERITIAR